MFGIWLGTVSIQQQRILDNGFSVFRLGRRATQH